MTNFDGVALLIMVLAIAAGCAMLGMGHWLNMRSESEKHVDDDERHVVGGFADMIADDDPSLIGTARK